MQELAQRDSGFAETNNVNVTESGLKQVGIQTWKVSPLDFMRARVCLFRSVALLHLDLLQAKEYNLYTPLCGLSPV